MKQFKQKQKNQIRKINIKNKSNEKNVEYSCRKNKKKSRKVYKYE